MDTISIASGTIKGYNYHGRSCVLDIFTCDGMVYQYFDVPKKIVDGLLTVKDPGTYYRDKIRKKFRRLFKAYDFC